MFFYLSKLLTFLISPIVWILTLLMLGLFIKNQRLGKKLVIAALCLLYVFSNSFIIDECFRLWEYTSEDFSVNEKYDCAIVLGGMSIYDARLDKPRFLASSDRIWQTLPLLKNNQIKKIIITGGSGSILHPEEKEAAIIKKYLLKIGMQDSSILIENESKNTRENAVNTKKLIDSLIIKPSFLLVTSAFHMRRGIACFKKAGIQELRPFCTDRFSGPRKFEFDHLFIPNPQALNLFTLLIHEITGYVIYKVRGFA